jgi:hypothetical protein
VINLATRINFETHVMWNTCYFFKTVDVDYDLLLSLTFILEEY